MASTRTGASARTVDAAALAEALARAATVSFSGTPMGPAMSQVVKRLLAEGALSGQQAAQLWRAIGFVQLPQLYDHLYNEQVVQELAQGIERGASSLRVGDMRTVVQKLSGTRRAAG